jgi:LPXTG-motif cell wall-anchored protein
LNIRVLLSCTAALAVASIASADSVGTYNPATGIAETTRIPGSLELIEQPRYVSPSFTPMPAPRGPCHTMVLTSEPIAAPVLSSFARMPDDRHPTVACEARVEPVRAAFIEPPRVVAVAEPIRQPYTEPVREPYVAPARVEVVTPAELPHTGSFLPLIGLLGLMSLGGAALVHVVRARG